MKKETKWLYPAPTESDIEACDSWKRRKEYQRILNKQIAKRNRAKVYEEGNIPGTDRD